MMSTDKYKTITLNAKSTGSFSTNLASFSFTGEVPQLPSSGMSPQLAPGYFVTNPLCINPMITPGVSATTVKDPASYNIYYISKYGYFVAAPPILIYDSTTNCFIDPFAKAKESTNKIEQAIKKDFMNLF